MTTKESLRKVVLAELNDRYTGLPDDYRRYVQQSTITTLRRVRDLAQTDAGGRAIRATLGMPQVEDEEA